VVAEGEVRFGGVPADADDEGVVLFDLGVVVAKGAGFAGAAGGEVLWVEVEDDVLLAAIGGEVESRAVVEGGGEVRGDGAGSEQRKPPVVGR
jgi:hypothetical protein